MAAKLTRKDLIQLIAIAVIAWTASQFLQRTAPIGIDVSSNATAQAILKDRSSPSRDVSDPTLTLVVFTDYQCPACKLADPQMMAAVEKDGHIRIVYKDWPIFGAISQEAARIAIASDRQGIYPAVHRRLMDERRPLNEQVMREAVTNSGGNWAQIESDLREYSADIERRLDLNRRDAFSLGLAGTPAYLIGPTLVSGGLDEEEFRAIFAESRRAGTQ
jgi:protein-disulfide isomerase